MSEPPPADLEIDTEEDGPPHSCYLLEFSVSPGGARLGDVYAGGTVDAVRAATERRWDTGDIDGYLIIWYGALLRLWVVQEGTIVEGVDLHRYLRTGDERCDRTLERVIACREERGDRWKVIDRILSPYVFDTATALPLLTRVLELQDRLEADPADAPARTELDAILEAAGEKRAPASYGGVTVGGLRLDWDALAAELPPLREPILETGRVGVRWADAGLRHPESYLHYYTDPAAPETLHAGTNDLESGEDEYPPAI